MRIVYLVPNLGDAAAKRRFSMFRAGGAQVAVAGFLRHGQASPSFEGIDPVCLGKSFDARMLQRASLVGKAALKLRRIEHLVETADLIVARNLEMLALAVLARRRSARRVPVVYECLDIHALMLSRSAPGRALRAIERWLLAQTSALIVSSPAFVENYFRAWQECSLPHLLVENRLLDLDGTAAPAPVAARPQGPPWRIGWFGIIRCRKSLEFLVDFARRHQGLVEIDMRGRPFLEAIPDIRRHAAGVSNVLFRGPYTAADLPAMYADVHFSWAIDFYEEGQNSSWLLPNRLYEGCSFGAVPIAMQGVETGAWLERRSVGLTLERLENLGPQLERMTNELFAALEHDIGQLPRNAFVATRKDCVDMVEDLALVTGLADASRASNRLEPVRSS